MWSELTTEQREYFKGFIDRQRLDAVKEYKAEQLRLHNVNNNEVEVCGFHNKCVRYILNKCHVNCGDYTNRL